MCGGCKCCAVRVRGLAEPFCPLWPVSLPAQAPGLRSDLWEPIVNPQELVSLHIGRRRRLDDEPQDRPLGAGTLDGAGSQPSRREKGPVPEQEGSVVSLLRYCVLFSLCNKIIK